MAPKRSLPGAFLRARRRSDVCQGSYSDAANPPPYHLGVALVKESDHTESPSAFDRGHHSFFGLDDLLAQVLGVSVSALMMRPALPCYRIL